MTTTQLQNYQAMFLLDNQEVREHGFNAIRDRVQATLEKHGLAVKVLRLWGERPLAYPIQGRQRATYLLGWLQGEGESVNRAKKDFYLVGPVLRVLFLREEAIPEEELATGIQEIRDDQVVIPDDQPETEPESAALTEEAEEEGSETSETGEGQAEEPAEAPASHPAEDVGMATETAEAAPETASTEKED